MNLQLRQRGSVFAAALWWGSLGATGGLAVPLLFMSLPSAQAAGAVAARLFAAQNALAIVCGVIIVLLFKGQAAGEGAQPRAQGHIFIAILGVLLALLIQFAVAPRIVARENLALWHTLGTAFFALQWLCAAALLWRLAVPVPASASVSVPHVVP